MIAIDQARANAMIGKTALVGISYCNDAGDVVRDEQDFGTILRINSHEGLVIHSAISDTEVKLPPDLDQYFPAAPGVYNLKSVSYAATNPDYISTWRMQPPMANSSRAP